MTASAPTSGSAIAAMGVTLRRRSDGASDFSSGNSGSADFGIYGNLWFISWETDVAGWTSATIADMLALLLLHFRLHLAGWA